MKKSADGAPLIQVETVSFLHSSNLLPTLPSCP